jgi:hypothetical protein
METYRELKYNPLGHTNAAEAGVTPRWMALKCKHRMALLEHSCWMSRGHPSTFFPLVCVSPMSFMCSRSDTRESGVVDRDQLLLRM